MTEESRRLQTALSRYAEGPAQLEDVLNGLPESGLDFAQTKDTWTIRQIVHHVVDGDELWKICIKAILGNNEGLYCLQWYWDSPQTEWVENWRYAYREIELSLSLFRANRQQVVEILQSAPNACEKSIRLKWPHKAEERITITYILEMQARHVTGHISDIQSIREMYHV